MKSSWCRAFPREGLPNQQAKPPFQRELNYLGLGSPVSHLFATPNHPEERSPQRCITQEEQGLTPVRFFSSHPGLLANLSPGLIVPVTSFSKVAKNR